MAWEAVVAVTAVVGLLVTFSTSAHRWWVSRRADVSARFTPGKSKISNRLTLRNDGRAVARKVDAEILGVQGQGFPPLLDHDPLPVDILPGGEFEVHAVRWTYTAHAVVLRLSWSDSRPRHKTVVLSIH
jgi:hypothetical protein